MALYVGENALIHIGKETAFGTPVARPVVLPAITAGLRTRQAPAPAPGLDRGTGGLPRRYWRGRQEVGGPLGLEFGFDGFGLLLTALLGPVAESGAGPYVHTWKMGTPVSLTIEQPLGRGRQGATEYSEIFAGCLAQRGTLVVPSNAPVRLDAEWICQSSGGRVAYTPASETQGNAAYGRHAANLAWNSLSIPFTEFRLTIENGFIFRDRNGAVTTAEPTRENQRVVRADVTLDLTGNDLRDGFDDETEDDLVLTLTSDDGELIVITLESARISEEDAPLRGQGRLVETVSFLPRAISTDTGASIVITNDTATGEV